jgi:hypothetical protein
VAALQQVDKFMDKNVFETHLRLLGQLEVKP